MTYPTAAAAVPAPGAAPPGPSDLRWLLDRFAAEAPGVTHAVIVSLDGLQLVRAGAAGKDLADQLAACTAGLLSLANQCGSLLGSGTTEHVTVRFGRGHLLCMRIGQTAGLLVAAEPGSDLRVLAYAMSQFVGSVTHVLAPPPRNG
jgi:hypothetical protein